MYIKTITIQGFKSYRDQTQIEPFSPRHNVVVGRNGSGKSNFFSAIRFVLSDAYTSMGREERQALLHEGVSTTTTLSAFVEIVFDNSDNRFPTGNDEVILRRTIGLKKDEYSLDKKSASKADVMNLLESAGFSKSNPYYIVPQGRITALTNAKDHERLAVLKDVAGTKVYEQRRAESLRIMDETAAKRKKITELLTYIDSRLTELEEEKEELKEYQDKDRDRRCLEYALYQRELGEVTEALNELEEDRRAEVHGMNVRHNQFDDRARAIQDLEKEIAEYQHAYSASVLFLQETQEELTDFVRTRTELACVVADLEGTSEDTVERRGILENEMASLEGKIAEKEQALSDILPVWTEIRSKEANLRRQFDMTNIRLQQLRAKKGRASKFGTKKERDAFLKSEIKSMEQYKAAQSVARETMVTQLERARQSTQEIDSKIAAAHNRMNEGKARLRQLADEAVTLKDRLAELTEQRKEQWREDTKLESTMSRDMEEVRKTERVLAGMMDKDTGTGLRAVDNISKRYNLAGVYGPLYRQVSSTSFDVFHLVFMIRQLMSTMTSLFHVVVDNDDTASRVLEVMLQEKTGRVTFMPLNRLHPKNPEPPIGDDIIPLLEKIEYAPEHEKAFQQVFGKTCVCRELQVAAAYVKSHGINTITLDGDKVDRKGALTGGYHDPRRSRIDAIKNVTAWRTKYEANQTKSKAVKAEITKLEQQITEANGHIMRNDAQQSQVREARGRLQDEGIALTRDKGHITERIAVLERDLTELDAELSSTDAKLSAYSQEINSPMSRELTEEEEASIEVLGKEVEQFSKELLETSTMKNEVDGKKTSLEIELNERLRRRLEELQTKLEGLGDADDFDPASAEGLAVKRRELRTLDNSISSLEDKVKAMEDEAEDVSRKIQRSKADLEKVQTQQADDYRVISKQQKTTERYLAKKQMLASRKDECSRSIRDLGVLPEEAFEKYTNDKPDRLVKKLHVVNENLKKFAHVNKKAFEQYSNFTKQKDQLERRQAELDRSEESIKELVSALDMRKDEAIERTFKQVASNFEEVFEKLVPAGRGRLIIQRRIDQDQEADDDGTQRNSIDNYTGVSIKVSFNSKVDEGLRIQQLSGGQKSLVALATVFAIQKCDPAPFYLFDEIDANLDAQYRTAVAAMIYSLSSTAQFITTTFRPEMLVKADKFYGVLFNNQKVSSIQNISRAEAMEFVDQVQFRVQFENLIPTASRCEGVEGGLAMNTGSY
ncbi:structural maintenance of chromosome protein 3 [Fistulina hepatica ATCC 64428]|uniref:Structural maintenance of chromosomes protein n=1 Tax=Fistulina hepatica ATCC 64428 TaxID=1128425 RepID=A0A0D7AAG6_9AGAR|nr:structural maintenance of chromosome protein 3 [Fistulina hepatica ATCC 64428]